MNAEPGIRTSEFWQSTIAALAIAIVGVAIAFGAPLTPEQKAALLAVIPPSIAIIVGVYSASRSWRKGKADEATLMEVSGKP